MKQTSFGGIWTEDKLKLLEKYLRAYIKIFTKNERAKYFKTIYVDAFAGSGIVRPKRNRKEIKYSKGFFPELYEENTQKFITGSTKIALGINPPFDRYLFIEKEESNIKELIRLKDEFSHLADRIEVVHSDANEHLKIWCKETDWNKHRSVVFLDPYGMSVEWDLLENLAHTKAVDLWLLFPLGTAVNRMLTRNRLPFEEWSNAITRTFGTEEWKDYFYTKRTEATLFGEEETYIKEADFDNIGKFFVDRLKTIFAGVAENPRPLFNSKNVPIFLLCFASANEKGSKTAINIAEYILG